MILVHECQYIDGRYEDVVDMREATGDEVAGFVDAWGDPDFEEMFAVGTVTLLPAGSMAQESSITKQCKVIFPDRN